MVWEWRCRRGSVGRAGSCRGLVCACVCHLCDFRTWHHHDKRDSCRFSGIIARRRVSASVEQPGCCLFALLCCAYLLLSLAVIPLANVRCWASTYQGNPFLKVIAVFDRRRITVRPFRARCRMGWVLALFPAQ